MNAVCCCWENNSRMVSMIFEISEFWITKRMPLRPLPAAKHILVAIGGRLSCNFGGRSVLSSLEMGLKSRKQGEKSESDLRLFTLTPPVPDKISWKWWRHVATLGWWRPAQSTLFLFLFRQFWSDRRQRSADGCRFLCGEWRPLRDLSTTPTCTRTLHLQVSVFYLLLLFQALHPMQFVPVFFYFSPCRWCYKHIALLHFSVLCRDERWDIICCEILTSKFCLKFEYFGPTSLMKRPGLGFPNICSQKG